MLSCELVFIKVGPQCVRDRDSGGNGCGEGARYPALVCDGACFNFVFHTVPRVLDIIKQRTVLLFLWPNTTIMSLSVEMRLIHRLSLEQGARFCGFSSLKGKKHP